MAASALPPRASLLLPALPGRGVARSAALVLLGSAALALSAHVQIPFWPVRLSMQSFVVLMIGFSLGGRLAAATIIAYLVQGAAGLPVFQGGAGLSYMAGPTGGYLAGFLLAATTVGHVAERGGLRTLPRSGAVILLGLSLIYMPGIAWLTALFDADRALAFGLLPFLTAEALKAALLLALVAGCHGRLARFSLSDARRRRS
jgi:biotin transport system substrate-specific component